MSEQRPTYVKTNWVNDETKLNAFNMNHIEDGIKHNNDLGNENAEFIDEIYDAFITQLVLGLTGDQDVISLSIGNNDASSEGYTPRFNANKSLSLKPLINKALPIVSDSAPLSETDKERVWIDTSDAEDQSETLVYEQPQNVYPQSAPVVLAPPVEQETSTGLVIDDSESQEELTFENQESELVFGTDTAE